MSPTKNVPIQIRQCAQTCHQVISFTQSALGAATFS